MVLPEAVALVDLDAEALIVRDHVLADAQLAAIAGQRHKPAEALSVADFGALDEPPNLRPGQLRAPGAARQAHPAGANRDAHREFEGVDQRRPEQRQQRRAEEDGASGRAVYA